MLRIAMQTGLQLQKKRQPRSPTQNWRTKSRKRKQTPLRKKRNRGHHLPRQRQQKRIRPETITRMRRNPRVFAKQRQNLTTKKRQRQSQLRARRPSPPLHRNQSGITRRLPSRNQRNLRRFRAKQKRLGNPSRREEKRKHQSRKKHRQPKPKSGLRRQNGQRQSRKRSALRHRRQRHQPNKKVRVLQAATAGRSWSKSQVSKRTRASSLRRRLRRDGVSGRGPAVRATTVI